METLLKLLLGIVAIVLIVIFFVPIICFIIKLIVHFWWVVALLGIFVIMTIMG